MIYYYLDASAWVKLYHQEAGTAWIRKFFNQKPTLACASIGVIEVTATLTRKQKTKAYSVTELDEKLDNLAEHWENFIQVHLYPEALTLAQKTARNLALRGADAVHLASALILQNRFTETTDQVIFVASDRELKIGAQASGLFVIDPVEDELAGKIPSAGSNEN
ncbi:MAG: type II toxin-antitoxin system VapC family toxin [Blastocatellia bacterium]